MTAAVQHDLQPKLVPMPGTDMWTEVQWLPCSVTMDLPVRKFTVRDLLRLEAQSVIATQTKRSSEIPVRVNGTAIAKGEFEVIGARLALRLTEI